MHLSFDSGATYDFCRVIVVFNIREGQIEGTDISRLRVAAIADTPEGHDRGELRHPVRGKDRTIDLRVLLGRLKA